MRPLVLGVALLLLTVSPAIASETVDAVWREQRVEFRFVSLEVAYSCHAMEAKITMLLRHVGAKDIQVTVPTCGGFQHPQRDHLILATFSTLVPAGAGDADVVKAAWTEVELGKWHPRSIDDQDCQLLESFQRNVLVTIEHEKVDGSTTCGASRRSIAGLLKLKVLKPVPAEDGAKKHESSDE